MILSSFALCINSYLNLNINPIFYFDEVLTAHF